MQRNKEIERFTKAYTSFLQASQLHNVERCQSLVKYLEEQEGSFWEEVLSFIKNAHTEIESITATYQDHETYINTLCDLLRQRNLPIDRQEAVLYLGPILIEPKLGDFYIQISLGRMKQRLTELEPNYVVKFIEKYYRKVNSSFNLNSFASKLMKAYDYVNRSMYASRQVQYGNAVSLDELFKIFTVSPSATDYKLENFLWDLGRLIASEYVNPNFQFEFGFSRQVGRMMIIRDADGNEHKYSSITIYKTEV